MSYQVAEDPTTEPVPVARRNQYRRLAAVALAGAAPSIVWAVVGAGFLTDDWSVWLVLERSGVPDGLHRLAFEQPGRPLAAPYYAVTYLGVGNLPLVQALLMAAINGGLLVGAWYAGREVIPRRILWPSLVVFALAPNHATTRLWFVVGTYPLALLMNFVALGRLFRGHPRSAAVLMAGAALLYEGAVIFTLAVVVLWALVEPRERRASGLLAVAPMLGVSALVFLISPKRGGRGPGPLDNWDSFIPGQIGTGLWGNSRVAQVGAAIVVVAITVSCIRMLPSFRSEHPEYTWIAVGSVLAVAGAVPFFVSGSIFGTTGVFDRNNLVPGAGVAIVLGATWSLLSIRNRPIATGLGAAALLWFVAQTAQDIDHFAEAVQTGEEIVATVGANVASSDDEALIVVPRQPDRGTGIVDFVYDGDLQGALRHRFGGDWRHVVLVENTQCRNLAGDGSVRVFDWQRSTVERMSADQLAGRCPLWLGD